MLLVSMNGYVLVIVVEFGCKVLFLIECLFFVELEDYVCGVKIV